MKLRNALLPLAGAAGSAALFIFHGHPRQSALGQYHAGITTAAMVRGGPGGVLPSAEAIIAAAVIAAVIISGAIAGRRPIPLSHGAHADAPPAATAAALTCCAHNQRRS